MGYTCVLYGVVRVVRVWMGGLGVILWNRASVRCVGINEWVGDSDAWIVYGVLVLGRLVCIGVCLYGVYFVCDLRFFGCLVTLIDDELRASARRDERCDERRREAWWNARVCVCVCVRGSRRWVA